MRFEDLIGHDRVRYFSYGRYALYEGIRSAGVRSGDRVLLPGYICRDVLSAIHACGAHPIYYQVTIDLKMDALPKELPESKAIIAVNYFGFPQDLQPFKEYCSRTGALLIEDNAHGLFSRDENGQFLGTRGDIGIFSLRKTIPMPNGAALVFNKEKADFRSEPQLEFLDITEPVSFKVKRLLMRLTPCIGFLPLRVFTGLARSIRRVVAGHEIMPSPSDAEHSLPGRPNPFKHLPESLAMVKTDSEIKRRRARYDTVREILESTACRPVFRSLPNNAVPYGYPFYCPEKEMPTIKKRLRRHGLECFQWPELPDAVRPAAPEHYKSVWLVNFLW